LTRPAPDPQERRVLIFAPVGKDASLLQAALARQDIATAICGGVGALAQALDDGAAAVVLTEEALGAAEPLVEEFLAQQPPWSDLPVLLLTNQGADSLAVARATHTLGNVTLLERPVRVSTLSSAVRTALRARERQYRTRAHLHERQLVDQQKDQFLAILAHELRNPLAPIRNAVQILRLSQSDPPPPRLCDMMERQIAHMIRLVDDLMEVSRITRGKIELRHEHIELASVLEAAIETSRPLIDAARLDLDVALPSEHLYLHADPVRLAQVFANLLNNAAKFTDPGGHISIVARREHKTTVVTVSDSGIGISPEALPAIFNMFTQADSTGKRRQSGLGIGLTIARSLVEMHGGRIAARSAGAGKGSEFSVRLPLSEPVDAQRHSTNLATQPLQAAPRVLVVDDNRDAADSMGTLLQMLGATVEVVHSGPAALQAIDAFKPAILFLDLGMPEIDGYEIARSLRARAELHDVTLIAVTGWGQEKDRDRTHAAGFDHHLVKPANVDQLKTMLTSAAKMH
jgi:signal transduction histidine kinase/ActR/RegA family two-component response regulator